MPEAVDPLPNQNVDFMKLTPHPRTKERMNAAINQTHSSVDNLHLVSPMRPEDAQLDEALSNGHHGLRRSADETTYMRLSPAERVLNVLREAL